MSKLKMSVTLAAVAVVVGAGLMIPLPWSLEAPLVIEPHDVRHVYTITPGTLVEIQVEEGQRVQSGDVLAVLVNPEKELEYLRLVRDAEIQRAEIETQRALQDFARKKLAEERLATLLAIIADYLDQLDKLTVRAPLDGVVVAAPRTPQPKHDETDKRLDRWYGTPLIPRNLGSFLEPRTHLLSIAPDEKFQAVLLIDQADRNELNEIGDIRIKLDHLPHKVYTAKIDSLSIRHVEFAPQGLSNKYQGDLPTVTDERGMERLTSNAYQATVILDEVPELLRSGFRGRGKFLVENRTTGSWLWRYIKQTFHFRL